MGFYRPTPFEVATGSVFGLHPEAELPRVGAGTPREVLEQLLLPHLRKSPCFVAFSGGVDSSLVLALATHLARRHRLDDPVPVTKRFTVESAQEDRWQEAVVRALGLRHWEVLRLGEELDLVGPVAMAGLRTFGLLWPATIFANSPMYEVARGGSVLTGEGGDEVLGWRRFSPVSFFLAGTRPNRERLKVAARSLTTLQSEVPEYPWLRAEARVRAQKLARQEFREPIRPGAALEHVWRRRGQQLALSNAVEHARTHDVQLVHPLFDRSFVRATQRWAGLRRWHGRRAMIAALFGDVMPQVALGRPTKATFDDVYFGKHTRAFVRQWDGRGVDESLVDGEKLRDLWSHPRLDGGTAILLQQARLGSAVVAQR